MKRIILNIAIPSLLIFSAAFNTTCSAEPTWENIGRENAGVRTAFIHPDNPRLIYIGSGSVLKSEDAGATWRSVLLVRGQNKAVNSLAFNPQEKNSLYAATGNGLFYSRDQGRNWKRIFQGKNYSENECKTAAVLLPRIYLGTQAGLFISKDSGRNWSKAAGKLGTSPILNIGYNLKDANQLYLACADGVFQTKDAGEAWVRIFAANPAEYSNDREEQIGDWEEEEKTSHVR